VAEIAQRQQRCNKNETRSSSVQKRVADKKVVTRKPAKRTKINKYIIENE
jgi:hypothetical protein